MRYETVEKVKYFQPPIALIEQNSLMKFLSLPDWERFFWGRVKKWEKYAILNALSKCVLFQWLREKLRPIRKKFLFRSFYQIFNSKLKNNLKHFWFNFWKTEFVSIQIFGSFEIRYLKLNFLAWINSRRLALIHICEN
jgi:hypothetical protein